MRNFFTTALWLALGGLAFSCGAVSGAAPSTAQTETWWRNTPTNIASTNATAPRRRALAVQAAARPEFHWRQIESTNYADYVQNLRSIGCPETTLQDIVTADVIGAYGSMRVEALAVRYKDFKFWQAQPEAVAELARQRRAIDAAMEKTFHQLLGTNFATPSTTVEWRAAELEQQLRFLSPEKRERTQVILARYAEVDEQIGRLADDKRRNEDRAELIQILADYQQKRAALAALLPPEESELVELTCSWTAHNLRRAMTHFFPTEAEFRYIFRCWQQHDEYLARIHARGEKDPENLHERVYEQIKGFLSAGRYQQYRDTWWE